MSDYNEITATITTEEPAVAATLDELRYLVFQGKKGDTGDSAYEEAVKLGFVGTEAEWLASLKGDPGPRGFSPLVEVEETAVGHHVTFTDVSGETSFNIPNGPAGPDGVSPVVSVENITGGHRVTIEDAEHVNSFDVMDGEKGDRGNPGSPGVSPRITVTDITGGHRVTIQDGWGESAFDVMDGQGGGSSDAVLYTEQTLTDTQKAQARENIGAGTYSKPNGGIPASDLAPAVQTSLGKADTALQTAPVTSVNGMTGPVTIPIPTVPQMATQANMSDWTSGKTVDAAVLKADFQSALVELDDVQAEVARKANASDIPTAVSDLTNDSGYQTAQDVATAIAAIPAVRYDVAQSLADAQKAQALKNIGAAAKQILSSMLIPILREGLYGTDQTAAILALENALGGETVTTYAITNALTNVTSSNSANAVVSGASYSATLTPDSGMELTDVSVVMGGTDITQTAYENGVVTIPAVTGDVVITAAAQLMIETVSAELTAGYVNPSNGSVGGTTSYKHTQIIPVRQGDKVYGSCKDANNNMQQINQVKVRFTATYDENGTIYPNGGSSTETIYKEASPFVVPAGVYGVVFSIINRYANDVVVTIDKTERAVS